VNAWDYTIWALLVAGVGTEVICCFGVLLSRDAFARLHYAAGATSIGPFCIGGAVLIREWITSAGIETIATVLVLFLANPVLIIATGRAARRIYFGSVSPRRGQAT
jgi:multisubunit Na+/H+ antiporter MnhG subunit